MRKGKRYKKNEKRLNNFLVFYLFIVLFSFVNYTFSRYLTTINETAIIKTAKFNIVVNEKKLGEEDKFNLLLSPNNDTYNNKLIPDSEGYFEISINPAETGVSLEYEFAFDLTKINSENRTINLTKYSVDQGNTFVNMPDNNIINGEINLKGNGLAFTDEDTIILRVYWEWKQDITNPTFQNKTIQVTSIIKQKVTSRSENASG